MKTEIIIARYNEDISWSNRFHDLRVIYNKGNSRITQDDIFLENMGRETDTFLRHIIRNYDSLADVSIFLQGCPHEITPGFSHGCNQSLQKYFRYNKGFRNILELISAIIEEPEVVLIEEYIHLTEEVELKVGQGLPETDVPHTGNPDNFSLHTLYKFLFSEKLEVSEFLYPNGAMFAISKNRIR